MNDFLQSLSRNELEFLAHDWLVWARDDQLPPVDESAAPWTTWLVLGGRGAGKTRCGAEWVRAQALGLKPLALVPVSRLALVGETLADVRSVMIEGVSGLLGLGPDRERPVFEPSKRRLVWKNGAIAQIFSSEDPDSLRGPQFGAAWLDELAKWRNADATWDMLQFGLRLGERPRQVVTTTPRAIPLIKKLIADHHCRVSRSATADNRANLAPGFYDIVVERYKGTKIGRQELFGELLEGDESSLWNEGLVDNNRVASPPGLTRIVIAVDPPATSSEETSLCGIIAAGHGVDGRAYVLEDATLGGVRPLGWAQRVVELYRKYAADCIVAEVNQGGEMVETILHQIDAHVPVKKVHARRNKWLRAEPVAALYERGRVSHVGEFTELEKQMLAFNLDDRLRGRSSPDRVDALVWALSELMLTPLPSPQLRRL